MTRPTHDQMAKDFDLWQEYVDTDGVITENDFHAMTYADRLNLIVETFGPEATVPTVGDALSNTSVGNGYHDWPVEGGTIRLSEAGLKPALEAAYDPSAPDWQTLVSLES